MVEVAYLLMSLPPCFVSSSIWPLIHEYVTLRPSSSLIEGAQPSFSRMSWLSLLRPRTPSGPGMCLMDFFFSSKLMMVDIMPFIETISSEPRLRGIL